jgi:hypothetical protein
MTGSHRAVEQSKVRVSVAGALTAGALILAPVGVAIATPGIAHAVPGEPGGGTGGPGEPGDGGTGGTGGPGTDTVHKRIIRLPGLKIEIKNIRGDHKPPKLKIVPFPGLNRILHPSASGGGNNCGSAPVPGDPTNGPGDPACAGH